MLKKIFKLSSFILLVGIILAGYHFKSQANEPSDQSQAPQAMPVSAMTVNPELIQVWKEYSARLEAVEYADIRPQVSGAIIEVKFTDGQHVEKDDVLFIIDPRLYKAAVNKGRAEVTAAKNQADLAEKELIRAEELIKTDAISKRIYDERKSAWDVAKANINSAYAQLEQAKVNLDYAYVKAPISGRLSRAEIKVGNLVEAGPNAPLLTSIVSVNGIYADFDVDEQTYIDTIFKTASNNESERKIPVKLTLNNSDTTYDGFIDSFDNQINPASGTIRARAFFENKEGHFLPGMFAKIKLGSAEKISKIIVSERAIGTDQDRKFVYVIKDDNTVEYRTVKIGDNIDGNRIIEDGLSAGEIIIVDGLIRIRPEMAVDPKFKEDMPNITMQVTE